MFRFSHHQLQQAYQMFSIFQIRIPNSELTEPLNNTLSYGTFSINGKSFFAIYTAFLLFYFQKWKNIKWWKCMKFFCIFTFNVKTFKIISPHRIRIENPVNASPFRIYLYVRNVSHMWKELTCSCWETLRTFF